MKTINIYYIFLLFIIFFNNYISCDQPEDNDDKNKNFGETVGKNLKQYQVGLLTKLPNGPLTKEAMDEAMQDELEKQSGITGNVGVIYLSEGVRNKKLGKMRIKSTGGIKLLFPTDKQTINYQNIKDNDKFKEYMEKNRITYEENKLIEAEKNFDTNPFKEIYDGESKLIKDDVLSINSNVHKKNLLKLAVDKEQEIYNNLVKNELNEVRVRHYNKGFYDQIYRHNLVTLQPPKE